MAVLRHISAPSPRARTQPQRAHRPRGASTAGHARRHTRARILALGFAGALRDSELVALAIDRPGPARRTGKLADVLSGYQGRRADSPGTPTYRLS
jgi:hypothetical protein